MPQIAALTSRARSALTFMLFMLLCSFFLGPGVRGGDAVDANVLNTDKRNAGPSAHDVLSSWTQTAPKVPSPSAARNECMGTGDPECPFGGRNMKGRVVRFPPKRIHRTDGPPHGA